MSRDSRLTRVEFFRTGHFFVDLGIVSLFDLFARKYEDSLTVDRAVQTVRSADATFSLYSDRFSMAGSRDVLNEEIARAMGRLQAVAFSRETRKGSSWWSGPAWTLFGQMKWSDVEKSGDCLLEVTRQGGICQLCGQTDRPVRTVGAVELPFAVDVSKFRCFYSGLRQKVNSCAQCRFAAWFAPLGLIYRISDDTLNAVAIEANALTELSDAIAYHSRLFAERTDMRSYESQVAGTRLPFETFVDFLLSAWRVAERLGQLGMLTRSIGAEHGKRLHLFSIEGRGEDKTFRRYAVLTNHDWLLGFFNDCAVDVQGRRNQPLVTAMRAMTTTRPDGLADTLCREELCRLLVSKASLRDVLERILCEKVLVRDEMLRDDEIFAIRRFFGQYETGVMRMDASILDSADSIGRTIGESVAEEDGLDKGVLYTLRNVRSLTDYLEALQQIFVRTVDGVRWFGEHVRKHLSELSKENWRDHRSLVVIYAVLHYQRVRASKRPAPGTSEASPGSP